MGMWALLCGASQQLWIKSALSLHWNCTLGHCVCPVFCLIPRLQQSQDAIRRNLVDFNFMASANDPSQKRVASQRLPNIRAQKKMCAHFMSQHIMNTTHALLPFSCSRHTSFSQWPNGTKKCLLESDKHTFAFIDIYLHKCQIGLFALSKKKKEMGLEERRHGRENKWRDREGKIKRGEDNQTHKYRASGLRKVN